MFPFKWCINILVHTLCSLWWSMLPVILMLIYNVLYVSCSLIFLIIILKYIISFSISLMVGDDHFHFNVIFNVSFTYFNHLTISYVMFSISSTFLLVRIIVRIVCTLLHLFCLCHSFRLYIIICISFTLTLLITLIYILCLLCHPLLLTCDIIL